MDLPEDQIQFGLVLSDGVEGTKVFIMPDAPALRTGEVLAAVWEVQSQPFLEQLTTNATVAALLANYGEALLPYEVLQAGLASEKAMTAGSLVATVGGTVHCGPASAEDRIVMFWSAAPANEEPYNPSLQVHINIRSPR